MKTEHLILDDFLSNSKQVKNLKTFKVLFNNVALKKMIEGELDIHLDYSKREICKDSISRNDYSSK